MHEWTLDVMGGPDVGAVAAIERASFRNPWPVGAFREELRNTHARCVVARAAPGAPPFGPTGVGGYICYWILGDELMINNIAVHPAARGRGLGRRLLRRALDDGSEAGCSTAWLEVRVSNVAAIALYEAHGFAVAKRRRGYYSDTREDALVMRAALKGSENG